MTEQFKYMVIFLTSISLLVVGCTKTDSNPQDVLSKYLDAFYNNRYEEAYQYISGKDKTIKSLQEYKTENADNPFAGLLANKLSFEIKDDKIIGNKAEITVEVTMPDYKTILLDIMGKLFLSFMGQEKDKGKLEEMIAEKYQDGNIPMTTITTSYDLLKEPNGWKVFLDWETERIIKEDIRIETEKRKKTRDSLAEAKKLYNQKKYNDALKKYDDVLGLDSTITEAKEGRRKTQETIKNLKDKKAYISKVVLKDFKVSKAQKYSFSKLEPAIFGTIVNKGNKTLRKVEITVYFFDKDGTVIGEEDFYPVFVTKYSFGDDKPLKPNYVKDFGYSIKDAIPSAWGGKATAKITNIEFHKE